LGGLPFEEVAEEQKEPKVEMAVPDQVGPLAAERKTKAEAARSALESAAVALGPKVGLTKMIEDQFRIQRRNGCQARFLHHNLDT
jgi:hypothetical protein